MQTRALEILNRVFRVLDHATQSLVRVRNVVAAVQIVVHEDFPVTLQHVNPPVEILQLLGELQRRHNCRNRAKKIAHRRRPAIQVHKHKILPSVHLHGHQPVFRAIEIAHALELHHAFQRTIVSISPPVIRTPELFRAAFRLRDHGRRMVPANVVKGAQHAITATRDNDRLSREVGREKTSFVSHLIGAPRHLPGFRKHTLLLEFVDARIEVPHA